MVVSIDLYVLLAVAIFLQTKHLVVDFYLQTPYMYLNKGTFLHPGGLIHAAFHALVTIVGLTSLPLDFGWLLTIGAVEFFVHYFMDWTKVNVCRWWDYHPKTAKFWEWLGLDQWVHQLNYIFTLAVCLKLGALAPPT